MTPPLSSGDYEKYLPLFRSLCRKYVCYGAEMDDLLQMCYFALHGAAVKYDEGLGVSFEAYLNGCVRNTILRELRDAKAYKDSLSLDVPVAGDDDRSLVDTLEADDSGIEDFELKELRHVLWPIVHRALNDREYQIVRGRYLCGKTLADIAKAGDVPIGRVNKAYQVGLDKLRRNRDITRIAQDYGIYRHVSLMEFKRTNTSSVEAEVLYREERREGKHGAGVCEEVL
jgi:RNA polymerase sigma factor (sigma-70 family)